MPFTSIVVYKVAVTSEASESNFWVITSESSRCDIQNKATE